MSFPASQQLLVEGLSQARVRAHNIKTMTQVIRTRAAAAPVPRKELIEYMSRLSSALDMFATVGALPGIGQYARNQFSDQTLDVVAEFTTMRNAITSLRDWIFNAFPTDAGSGAWLVSSYSNEGRPTELTFTVAQLSGLVTRCDAVIAAIG